MHKLPLKKTIHSEDKMRFSIACTIAVLLQTAFAAPLTAGNGPSAGTVEDSTNAVPHCQSGADYDHHGIAKRGKGESNFPSLNLGS